MRRKDLEKAFGVSYDTLKKILITRYNYENSEDHKESAAVSDDQTIEDNVYEFLTNSELMNKWSIDKIIVKMNKRGTAPRSNRKYALKTIPDLNETDGSEEEEETDWLLEHAPKESFSPYYELLYSTCCLFEFCKPGYSIKKNIDYVYVVPVRVRRFLRMFDDDIFLKMKWEEIEEQNVNPLKSFINYVSNRCIKNEEKSLPEYIYLTIRLTTILARQLSKNSGKRAVSLSNYNDIVVAKMALSCTRHLSSKNDLENAKRFFPLVLTHENSADWRTAFNSLGLCAVRNKKYQFAYDVFFSWINKDLLTSVKRECGLNIATERRINHTLQSDQEKEWRRNIENSYYISELYVNYANLCIKLFNLYSESKQREVFLNLAINYVSRIDDLDNSEEYYQLNNAGIIMSYARDYKKAIEYFERAFNGFSTRYERVIALKSIISTYYQADGNVDIDISEYYRLFIRHYKELLDISRNDSNLSAISSCRDMYFLLSSCTHLKSNITKIRQTLLSIDSTTNNILHSLRKSVNQYQQFDLHLDELCSDEEDLLGDTIDKSISKVTGGNSVKNEIAYYTTLETLMFLFDDPTEKEEDKTDTKKTAEKTDSETEEKTADPEEKEDKKKNRFSMMHVRYMNDTDEGLILLKSFKNALMFDPEELRYNLYDQKFVFLKSFTGLVDKLNMWTLYGSDRKSGDDCNGCCVSLAPETFDVDSEIINSSDETASHYIDDDYNLFAVAYIDRETDEITIPGMDSSEIKRYYDELTNELKCLNDSMKKSRESDKAIIADCLVRLLEKPMFLFKDKSYYLEAESRLIITRDFSDWREVHTTKKGEPHKLMFKPPLQVFPKKIVLGPKVESVDDWMPRLQYELSKIQEKWNYEDKDYKPVVRKSDINIR